jgi:hypothetical protein
VAEREERLGIGGHERHVGGAIGHDAEHLGRPRTHTRDKFSGLGEPRRSDRTRTVGQHGHLRPGTLQQVVRSQLMTGMGKDQDPR